MGQGKEVSGFQCFHQFHCYHSAVLPKTLQIDTDGCRFIIFDKQDIISDSIRYTGSFEQVLIKIANEILKAHENGVVIDIGGNIGTFTIPLAKQFPNIKFNVYEPQRIIYYQLCANIIINSLDNVYAYEYGISDKEQELLIELPDYSKEGNIGAFSLDPETRENQYEVSTKGSQEYIITTTLDSLNIKDIKLIKIDVEGMELAVIRGALKTLIDNEYPPIFFEAWTFKEWFQPKRKELIEFLESLGYKITQLGENNLAQHTSKPMYNVTINSGPQENTNIDNSNIDNNDNNPNGI